MTPSRVARARARGFSMRVAFGVPVSFPLPVVAGDGRNGLLGPGEGPGPECLGRRERLGYKNKGFVDRGNDLGRGRGRAEKCTWATTRAPQCQPTGTTSSIHVILLVTFISQLEPRP